MIYILSIVTGVLGALASWLAVLVVTVATGSDGTTALIVIGPLAAIAGFLTVVALTFHVAGGIETISGIAIRSIGVVLLAATMAAGGLHLRDAAMTHLGLIAKLSLTRVL